MRFFTVVSALIVVATSSAAAAPGGSVARLFDRQSSTPDIPAECEAQCATAQTIPDCGDNISCLCSTEMGQSVVDCGNCGMNAYQSNPDVTTQFEAGIKEYTDSCNQAGHPVGPLSATSSSTSSPTPRARS